MSLQKEYFYKLADMDESDDWANLVAILGIDAELHVEAEFIQTHDSFSAVGVDGALHSHVCNYIEKGPFKIFGPHGDITNILAKHFSEVYEDILGTIELDAENLTKDDFE